MKSISIEMFPARNGDSFLIRFNNKKNIVIDMGYDDTYFSYIKHRFQILNNIDKQQIDLLVISHIDEDHILGAIEFVKENGYYNNQKIIKVDQVWHNSYKHLQFKKKVPKVLKEELSILNGIKIENSMKHNSKNEESSNISANQGSTFAGYLYKFGYSENAWNRDYCCNAVNIDYKSEVNIGDIKIILLSPNEQKLTRLSNKWLSFLQSKKFDFKLSNESIFDDAYEYYFRCLRDTEEIKEFEPISYQSSKFDLEELKNKKSRYKDKSCSNGSSISFIIEYNGKKILFLGDSHEDVIVNNLENLSRDGYELNFNVVKVSHHGSLKNNDKWIDLISSDYYLFSTDGEGYGHPDEAVIAKIITSNKKDKILVFNYHIDLIRKFDDANLKKIYKYEIKLPQKNESSIIDI